MKPLIFNVKRKVFFSIVLSGLCLILSTNCFSQGGAAINSSGAPADPSALLDVNSTVAPFQGTLITRLTTLQRNTITSPAQGLMIYNITTKCFEYWEYGSWQTGMCAVCPTPAAPTAGTHTLAQKEIIWNWNSVSGVAGYKWNTTNDYNSATDMNSSTTKTETGLACATSYTRYVWAYNSCGTSSAPTILTATTLTCWTQ